MRQKIPRKIRLSLCRSGLCQRAPGLGSIATDIIKPQTVSLIKPNGANATGFRIPFSQSHTKGHVPQRFGRDHSRNDSHFAHQGFDLTRAERPVIGMASRRPFEVPDLLPPPPTLELPPITDQDDDNTSHIQSFGTPSIEAWTPPASESPTYIVRCGISRPSPRQ